MKMGDSLDKPLILSDLTKDTAILALGAVATKELLIRREVAFFVDLQGQIQIIPIAELLLDALPEQMAIQEMLKQQLVDEDITLYLRGRDARMRARNVGIL